MITELWTGLTKSQTELGDKLYIITFPLKLEWTFYVSLGLKFLSKQLAFTNIQSVSEICVLILTSGRTR
jgi:hypothetical protein